MGSSKHFDQSGFSLVQLVASIALGSMISVGIFQAINHGLASQQRISQLNTYDDFIFEIKDSLANQAQCTSFLSGVRLSTNPDMVNVRQDSVIPASRTLASFSNSSWGNFRYGNLVFSESLHIEISQLISPTVAKGKIYFIPLNPSDRSELTYIKPRPAFAQFTINETSGTIISCRGISESDLEDTNSDGASLAKFRIKDRYKFKPNQRLQEGSRIEYPEYSISSLPEGQYEISISSTPPTFRWMDGSTNEGNGQQEGKASIKTEVLIDGRIKGTVIEGTGMFTFENQVKGPKKIKVVTTVLSNHLIGVSGNTPYGANLRNRSPSNIPEFSLVAEKVSLIPVVKSK